MKRSTAWQPAIVGNEPVVTEPEDALAELVPQMIAAEREASDLRRRIDTERQRLAVKRGVSFIREEHVRREFGR
jgi:hypothetical protein